MHGDKQAIELLNKVLENELVAVNQYFLYEKQLRHWGLVKLADHTSEEIQEELGHATKLAERVMFIGGTPSVESQAKVPVAKNSRDVLRYNLQMEQHAILELREAIRYMNSIDDFGSADLLKEILSNEEEHASWLQTQLELITRVGLENYLQSKI